VDSGADLGAEPTHLPGDFGRASNRPCRQGCEDAVPLGSLLALFDMLVRRFRYVGKTIALILAFVGIKNSNRRRPRRPSTTCPPGRSS
jgi:hypothetical protein